MYLRGLHFYLQDSVPKVLMHFLVNTVQRGLQQHLIRTLYREELFGEVMNEREDVAIKRQQCQEVGVVVMSLDDALCDSEWRYTIWLEEPHGVGSRAGACIAGAEPRQQSRL